MLYLDQCFDCITHSFMWRCNSLFIVVNACARVSALAHAHKPPTTTHTPCTDGHAWYVPCMTITHNPRRRAGGGWRWRVSLWSLPLTDLWPERGKPRFNERTLTAGQPVLHN